jgi:hypothetical protein
MKKNSTEKSILKFNQAKPLYSPVFFFEKFDPFFYKQVEKISNEKFMHMQQKKNQIE